MEGERRPHLGTVRSSLARQGRHLSSGVAPAGDGEEVLGAAAVVFEMERSERRTRRGIEAGVNSCILSNGGKRSRGGGRISGEERISEI